MVAAGSLQRSEPAAVGRAVGPARAALLPHLLALLAQACAALSHGLAHRLPLLRIEPAVAVAVEALHHMPPQGLLHGAALHRAQATVAVAVEALEDFVAV